MKAKFSRAHHGQRQAAAALLCLLVAGVLLVRPASSTIPALSPNGNTPAADRWDFTAFPVTWSLNPAANGNVPGASALPGLIQTAFNTWTSAPNAALAVGRGPNSSATSGGFDPQSSSNINLICFVCQGDFSKDAETLAVTITTIENSPGGPDGHGGRTRFVGQILDADILFNPNDQFSTGGGGNGQDLLTVATHEIGHFLGLDHSGVVRAVMFPFAPTVLTTLSYDDVAGISALYPKPSPDVPTGTISGAVHMGSGSPVFGAHVFAESQTSALPFGGSIRKSPISAMTAPDGAYTISGLPADSYIVVAEPLDGPVSDSDVESFPKAFHQSAVQTGFTTRWH
ncbi:MAG TPA: matrixin family metalloprotease [Terriglobales bacterium]|nr:matrixin family metalloprotease [Terriglobales bacterium]